MTSPSDRRPHRPGAPAPLRRRASPHAHVHEPPPKQQSQGFEVRELVGRQLSSDLRHLRLPRCHHRVSPRGRPGGNRRLREHAHLARRPPRRLSPGAPPARVAHDLRQRRSQRPGAVRHSYRPRTHRCAEPARGRRATRSEHPPPQRRRRHRPDHSPRGRRDGREDWPPACVSLLASEHLDRGPDRLVEFSDKFAGFGAGLAAEV